MSDRSDLKDDICKNRPLDVTAFKKSSNLFETLPFFDYAESENERISMVRFRDPAKRPFDRYYNVLTSVSRLHEIFEP